MLPAIPLNYTTYCIILFDTIVLGSQLFNKDSFVMDDWKLKTAPVVRLKAMNKRFAISFVSLCKYE